MRTLSTLFFIGLVVGACQINDDATALRDREAPAAASSAPSISLSDSQLEIVGEVDTSASYASAASTRARCRCDSGDGSCTVSVINPGDDEPTYTCSTSDCSNCDLKLIKGATHTVTSERVAEARSAIRFESAPTLFVAEPWSGASQPTACQRQAARAEDSDDIGPEVQDLLAAMSISADPSEPQVFVEVRRYRSSTFAGRSVALLGVSAASRLTLVSPDELLATGRTVDDATMASASVSCDCVDCDSGQDASGACKREKVSGWPGPTIYACKKGTCSGCCDLVVETSSSTSMDAGEMELLR